MELMAHHDPSVLIVGAGPIVLALSLDLTLKAGDIVVTDKGVRQFRGSRNFPYAERDFAAYDSGSGMSAEVKVQVEGGKDPH